MKMTRHNGRSGSHGTYNPKHNDRNFDTRNSEHIDPVRGMENIYWDCMQGLHNTNDLEMVYASFEEVELAFYQETYSDFINSQNERNERNRHSERNRSVNDLYKNNKTCPEESIIQIGNIDESIPGDVLVNIVNDFFGELQERYGEHYHILDWALHLDESTPHIHERHVFDCENKYGEICPQQEKSLEAMGIDLPFPEKPVGKNNNRKMTFDKSCRELLMEICEEYRLDLDREPSYGGRPYLEKQDYIIEAQKQRIAEKEAQLDNIISSLSDVEQLSLDIATQSYEKAVEVVTETVQAETIRQEIKHLEGYGNYFANDWTIPDRDRNTITKHVRYIIDEIKEAASKLLIKVQNRLRDPRVRSANISEVQTVAKQSIREKLRQAEEIQRSYQESRRVVKQKKKEKVR